MNLLQGTPWHAYVQPIGWTLVHFLWQGAVIALLLSMTLLFLRTRSANARYLAATLALGGMALCPPLTLAVLTSRQAQALPGSGATLVFAVPAPEGSAALQPALSLQQTALPGGSITASPASGMNGLLPGLVAAWLLGVLLLSARLLGGWVRVQRLMRRAARPIEDPVAARCAALARRMGIARPVALRASAAVQVPAMAGCLRAVILFPAGALSGLPVWQIEALLAHELAHVRRQDYLINLAQSLIETLLFYHPGVWWVSRHIRIERELCCDDLVVQVLDDRVGYARALTTLEQMRSQPASPALAATDGDLLARVRRILGLPSEKVRITPLPSSGTFSLLFCMALCAGLFLQLARAGQAAGNTSPAKSTSTQTAGPASAAPPTKAERHVPSPSGQAAGAASLTCTDQQSSAIVIAPESDDPDPRIPPANSRALSPAMPGQEPTPAQLAALAASARSRSGHPAHLDTARIEREMQRLGRRMDAISRRLKEKDLTCRQRKALTDQLGALGGELGLKAATMALEQASQAGSMAEKAAQQALDQIDVQKLVEQSLRAALQDKDKAGDHDMDPPDLPDPPDPPDSGDSTDD